MSDGYELHGRSWPSRPDRRITYVYIHGIQSHGGWFEHSASILAEQGDEVILADRRGSGLNTIGRGDTPSFGRWFDDLHELSQRATAEGRILRLVGVSWGAKLAIAWILRRSPCVDGMLLVAPGVFPRVDVGFANRLRIAAAAMIAPTTEFELPLSDPALFTRNPAGREFIAADPLKLTHATARFLYNSARLDWIVRSAASGELAMPVTTLLADHDEIIQNAPLIEWLRRVAPDSAQVELRDADHTPEFDAQPREMFTQVRRWAAEQRDELRSDS